MTLLNLLRRRDGEDPSLSLYAEIVAQARQPGFYAEFGVPDTLDGRFDMLVLHAYLFFDRLRGEGDEAQDLGQRVFDAMFRDLDQNLREIGISDVTIGKRVKKMVAAFYGRSAAYDKALAADGEDELVDALKRNIFPECEPDARHLRDLAAYVGTCRSTLREQDMATIFDGALGFPPPPRASS